MKLAYALTVALLLATPLGAQTVNINRAVPPVAVTMQNAVTANGDGASLPVSGFQTATVSVTASVAMSGGTTVNFEKSVDDATWVATRCWTEGSDALVTTTAAAGDFTCIVQNYKSLRARISGYSAGTVTAKGYASFGEAPRTMTAISGTVPVSGTVSANAGTNLNTSLLALESGGNLATIAAKDFATSAKQDTGNTSLASIDGKIIVVDTGDVTISAMSALPAGNNNIGDVDVASVAGNVTVVQGTATNLKMQAEVYQGGTAVGAAAPLQVSIANTGANATAVKVDGSATTQPVSIAATVGTNIAQVAGGTTVLAGDVNNVAAITNTQDVAPVGRYDSTQPTLTNGRFNLFQLDSRGSLNIAKGAGGFSIDNSSFAATQSGNWNVRNQDGAGNALTSNSTTYTAKFGLDVNVLGTLGTAFSTAGKVDVKAADGDISTLGTKTDAKSTATDGTSTSVVSILKEISAMAQAPAALPANQSVNVAQIAGTTTTTGAGTVGAGTQRTTLASDDPAVAALGVTTGTKVTTDANGTLQQYLRGLVYLQGRAAQQVYGSTTTVINTGTDIASTNFSGAPAATFDNTTDTVVPYARWAKAVAVFPDWAAAPVAGTTVDLYGLLIDVDGTSDETQAPASTASGGARYFGSFVISADDALQRRTITIDLLGVEKVDFYIRNNTAQNMNNDAGTNATVKITPFSTRTAQ